MHRVTPGPAVVETRTAMITGLTTSLLCCLAVAAGCTTQSGGGGGWFQDAFRLDKDKHVGEEWTILCLEARDQNRVKNSDALVSALKQVRQLDASKAYVVHGDHVSAVYYGSYYRRPDRAGERETFGPEVKRDLQFIRSLSAGASQPFLGARLVAKPTPDPGRPEWHITKCPGKYTLQIGVFYNTATFDERKLAAVQWVEQLRKEGVEAYYHHGETRSSVTVGSFGEQDIQREQIGPRFATGNTVIHYGPKVEGYRQQERFRYNLENGHKIKRILQTMDGPQEVYQESFLMPVPSSTSTYGREIEAVHRGAAGPEIRSGQESRPQSTVRRPRSDF